ncbi:hypothetical protein IU397_05050 [Actibacterium sp. 188UL27-1]|nr:hypothetical protein [Actibacterium sp. 188UL27-1]
MKLARVIRLDESDLNVFDQAGTVGEWAIPGTFAFSDWTEAELTGKARQAFANGWLGLESFGRSTFVAVARITEPERAALIQVLAGHFAAVYGAPSVDAALPVAEAEIDQMIEMCSNQDDNTLLVVERSLEESGVRERFRIIAPQGASLEAFAVHGD